MDTLTKDISDNIKETMLKAIQYTKTVEELDRIVNKLSGRYPLFDGLLYNHASVIAEEHGLTNFLQVFLAAERKLSTIRLPVDDLLITGIKGKPIAKK